jgi:nitroreductase
MQRRTVLKTLGGVAVVVAAGGVWRAFDQGVFSAGEGPAYEPWRTWRGDSGDGPLSLVGAAILAANPHNTQPWRFRVTPSRIDLFADTTRNIGATDPFRREMYVGVGCALENLLLAAHAQGYAASLALTPDSADPAHAAGVDLSQGTATPSEMYQAIPLRHTNRGPYDVQRSLSRDVEQALQALNTDTDVALFWFTADADRRRIGQLIVEASQAIIADREQSHDSARWYRFRWKELQQHRDGITMDAMGASPILRAAAKILPPLSHERNDAFWLKATRDVHVATAGAYGVLAVRNADDISQRLRCGQLWQRMHLWATTQGIAMQPLNQIPERDAREQVQGIEPRFGNALRHLAGSPEWHALMVFRAGYPSREALPSPRRPVESVLMPSGG